VCQFTRPCDGVSGAMYKFDKSDSWTFRFVPPCQECPIACIFQYETDEAGLLLTLLRATAKYRLTTQPAFAPAGRFRGKGGTGGC
jgi:hypothetical protein